MSWPGEVLAASGHGRYRRVACLYRMTAFRHALVAKEQGAEGRVRLTISRLIPVLGAVEDAPHAAHAVQSIVQHDP